MPRIRLTINHFKWIMIVEVTIRIMINIEEEAEVEVL